MKFLVILLVGLVGCASTTAVPVPQKALLDTPQAVTPAPVIQAVAPALPTAEQLEKIAFENDRNSAIAFATSVHDTMKSTMELPEGTVVKQQTEEVVFADERAVAVVRMKTTFILNNQVVDEVMVSFFIVKASAGEWMFKSLAARPTKEMVLRRMKALQQSQERREREDSNGTKL